MNIFIVTPVKPDSQHGNWNTATRWAALLRASGHKVEIVMHPDESQLACDCLVALHAKRSAEAIQWWKSKTKRPLILALTGTDLYRDIHSETDAQRSMQLADAMIVLQKEGPKELPVELRAKTTVIYQSVSPASRLATPADHCLITVIGHLREVKDPLRAAYALKHLPADSRIQVVQLGCAMSDTLAQEAQSIANQDSRYQWLGELPHEEAMNWLARSRAMVISSRMEGGAHVVSEAIACGVPVLASRIPGNLGLLGHDYPGYFTLEDQRELANLMTRLETDRKFEQQLTQCVINRRHLVDAKAEQDALNQLLHEVSN